MPKQARRARDRRTLLTRCPTCTKTHLQFSRKLSRNYSGFVQSASSLSDASTQLRHGPACHRGSRQSSSKRSYPWHPRLLTQGSWRDIFIERLRCSRGAALQRLLQALCRELDQDGRADQLPSFKTRLTLLGHTVTVGSGVQDPDSSGGVVR